MPGIESRDLSALDETRTPDKPTIEWSIFEVGRSGGTSLMPLKHLGPALRYFCVIDRREHRQTDSHEVGIR
jgi:hypothetical protein